MKSVQYYCNLVIEELYAMQGAIEKTSSREVCDYPYMCCYTCKKCFKYITCRASSIKFEECINRGIAKTLEQLVVECL